MAILWDVVHCQRNIYYASPLGIWFYFRLQMGGSDYISVFIFRILYGRLDVDEKKILQLILKEYGKMWDRFSWLRI
jgi:hypothetical protein